MPDKWHLLGPAHSEAAASTGCTEAYETFKISSRVDRRLAHTATQVRFRLTFILLLHLSWLQNHFVQRVSRVHARVSREWQKRINWHWNVNVCYANHYISPVWDYIIVMWYKNNKPLTKKQPTVWQLPTPASDAHKVALRGPVLTHCSECPTFYSHFYQKTVLIQI